LGEDAVDRACRVIAVGSLSVFATHEATIGHWGDHRLGSELGTSTTGLGARAPGGPGRKDAVNGASLGPAGGGRGQSGAHYTAVLDVSDNGTRLGHGASAAGLGAGTVSGPAGDLAVDDASKSVAWVGGSQHRAGHAAKLGSGDDGTRLALGASTAGLGADTVDVPGRDLAVNGAKLIVARASFGLGARVTIVLVGSDNNVVTRLIASGTCLAATSPRIPFEFTVDFARTSVAVTFFLESRAARATANGTPGDHTGARLNATVAWLRAFAPGSPAANSAGFWATESVAVDSVCKGTTFVTTVAGGNNRGLGVRLGAGGTI
jgi:hypothetical protein